MVGSTPSDAPPSKRARKSKAPSSTVENDIPSSPHYQISYAHRSVVTGTCYSKKHDIVLTASQDGIVKFWKRTSVSSPPLPEKKSAIGGMSGKGGSTSNDNSNNSSTGQCLEFIKSYVAHTAPPLALVSSLPEGDNAASVGEDNVIKFYDVGGFDVTGMIQVQDKYKCGPAVSFIGEDQSLLAVSSKADGKSGTASGTIFIFSSLTLSPVPVKEIQLHAAPLTAMCYNYEHHCMISVDKKGVIEYWNGAMLNNTFQSGGDNDTMTTIDDYDTLDNVQSEKTQNEEQQKINDVAFSSLGEAPLPSRNGITYTSKMDTDLYSLLRKKNFAVSIAISPTGNHFAIYGSDRKVRLFEYKTGKSVVQYDERMKVYDAMVQKQMEKNASGASSNSSSMDNIDYGKRAARERELSETSIMGSTDNSFQECGNQSMKIQFDPSGRYLLLPTIIGIKVIEWSTSKCKKVMGKGDASGLRFLGGCICLGDAKVDKQMQLARSGGSSAAMGENKKKVSDAMLVALAFNKKRFYIFSNVDPIKEIENSEGKDQQEAILARDILNEPPDVDDLLLNGMEGTADQDSGLGKEAILRTTMGDIHIRLFANETPKTVENFCGHSRSGYYDNVIFHRVIKGFMIQTGDPLGDGTGGESIWGGEFEDEFVRELRHDRPFTVSMANAGPGTNGSQFFITTVPCPWLDNKHTVFGRVTKGMDICAKMEAVKVDEVDKPLEEISIVSVDIA
eukprot:CAMPEP_0203684800 /NCGR_PEP_ID=MMETSP0090-20130426/48221_1 /ASSEMBLY_ACC=CAM_ASM_001088 /TAXON_ID=426623 /ORGANISM="Chaetoceros affinis, Strain CCMP159" /LENGTH=729 /DNA_ID=CAMNT_0050553981 /DNA_START=32 /DNA_END=2221 /DNA_ORIENTATION=+